MKKVSHNIILYKCRERLKRGLKDNLIERNQKIYIIEEYEKLKEFLKSNEIVIIINDKEIKREEIIKEFKKLKKSNIYLILLVTNNEMRKINLKQKREKNILYISNPATMMELSQYLKMLFEKEEMGRLIEDYKKIIEAYEQATEFSRKELMDAYESLKAQEEVSELSRKELVEKQKSLEAWEKTAELAREEKMELENVQGAMNSLVDFEVSQKEFLEKILDAWDRVMEMGRKELLEAYKKINRLKRE